MATSLEESKRSRSVIFEQIPEIWCKDRKIGPVDSEIMYPFKKEEEINASKIYSPVGKFAQRTKKLIIFYLFAQKPPVDGFSPTFAQQLKSWM